MLWPQSFEENWPHDIEDYSIITMNRWVLYIYTVDRQIGCCGLKSCYRGFFIVFLAKCLNLGDIYSSSIVPVALWFMQVDRPDMQAYVFGSCWLLLLSFSVNIMSFWCLSLWQTGALSMDTLLSTSLGVDKTFQNGKIWSLQRFGGI